MPALVLLLAANLLCAGAHATQNVLMVFDEDKDLPGLALINRSLREVFRAEMKDGVELYSESLQASQFREAGYYGTMRENLRRKYAGKRLDLIVAVMAPSLEFLMQQGEALFPGVPVVFCGADPSDVQRKTLPANVTGVLVERAFAPTLEVALRLQPDAREVFVVGGTSQFDQQIQGIARQDLQPYQDRVRITWLTGLPMEKLLGSLSALPAGSAVYYLTLFADGAGRTYSPHEALSRITAVANAPVYASLDQYIGLGVVGGHVYSVGTHGRQAAEIGVRILRGEAPLSIPIVAREAAADMFDWRQLQRWRLDERRLPQGSIVEFQPPSMWELYRWTIVAGVALFLLQTALVASMLVNRVQRRRAEEAARRQRNELAHALRVATIGELTASFAHELNQPLTAIAANALAARRMLAADRANPEVDAALDDMASEAHRAAETVRRLRALFRKEAAGQSLVEVNALIDDVLNLLEASIRDRKITVRFRRGELPAVRADELQLRQVFVNLLVNAQDAIGVAGEGPREIDIETVRADAACVAITIRDSGAGAPEADLERIFEPFVTSKPRGLGLGLAITRSILQAHGGRIWASRNADRGLSLHVELPVPHS